MRPSVGLPAADHTGVILREFTALKDAFYNTAAQHGERALRYGFSYGRGNHRPDCFLRFGTRAARRFGMLQQSGHQRAFWRAENPLVPH
jgi:hypothetical protein